MYGFGNGLEIACLNDVVSERNTEQLATAIEEFVRQCEVPALLEKGEEPLALLTDRFRIEVGRRGLWLEAWDERRLWSRKILSAEQPRRNRMELEAFRLGKKPVRVTLVDVADTRSTAIVEKTQRSAFGDQFRLFLNRHFGCWRLEEFRAEANLEESMSPLYPSALYTRGQEAVAAVGAPPRDTSFHALTFALIFLAGIRKRHGEICASRLLLYLPEKFAQPVVTLARHLDARKLKVEIWLYREDGAEWRLDVRDKGNLDSALALRASRLAGPAWWLDLLDQAPEVDAQEESDGAISYRIRGYEVARLRPGWGNALPDLLWGPRCRQEARPEARGRILEYFQRVAERRHAGAADRLDPLYLASPESWLESAVRGNLGEIDASLTGELYGQVIASHAGERGAVDLLGVDFRGRLAVLELKATEDIHLPLQAFDYWLRIRKHLETGSFGTQGYFPGRMLANEAPRLLLVSPALHLHSTTQAILHFFPPDCSVEIIGLGANWRQRADVALRM